LLNVANVIEPAPVDIWNRTTVVCVIVTGDTNDRVVVVDALVNGMIVELVYKTPNCSITNGLILPGDTNRL
jgi:hypothetical protein